MDAWDLLYVNTALENKRKLGNRSTRVLWERLRRKTQSTTITTVLCPVIATTNSRSSGLVIGGGPLTFFTGPRATRPAVAYRPCDPRHAHGDDGTDFRRFAFPWREISAPSGPDASRRFAPPITRIVFACSSSGRNDAIKKRTASRNVLERIRLSPVCRVFQRHSVVTRIPFLSDRTTASKSPTRPLPIDPCARRRGVISIASPRRGGNARRLLSRSDATTVPIFEISVNDNIHTDVGNAVGSGEIARVPRPFESDSINSLNRPVNTRTRPRPVVEFQSSYFEFLHYPRATDNNCAVLVTSRCGSLL